MAAVVLNAFPVDLFTAFDEVTDGLLRELLLIGAESGEPFTAADAAAAAQAKACIADAVDGRRGHIDVTLELTAPQASMFGLLQAVLEHANRLAHDEHLLALPVLPEVAAFRNWMCEQVIGQLNGGHPEPWQLPSVIEPPGVSPAPWPGTDSLPAGAWIVGDAGNRIVGASSAALEMLGWDVLVGERILAVIPHEFREAHLAAFTRGVASGEHHLLDRPLAVEALTRDGRRVPVTLTVSRKQDGGRSIYLAHLAAR